MDNCDICKTEIYPKDLETKLVMNIHVHMECYHVFHKTCMLKCLQTCHDNGWRKRCPLVQKTRQWVNCTY